MTQDYEIFIDYRPYTADIGIYFTARDYSNKRRMLAKPVDLVFEPIEEGMAYPAPTIKISGQLDRTKDGKSIFLEALRESLEKSGYGVKFSEETAGELKATKYHLEDMRLLAKVKKLQPPPR